MQDSIVARMEKRSAAIMKALAVQFTLERAGIWSVVDESWDMIADLMHSLLVSHHSVQAQGRRFTSN